MLLFLFLIVSCCLCSEMLVTKEYTEYLKKHVSWEVVEYEDNIFRGWTIDDFKSTFTQELPQAREKFPEVVAKTALPSKVIWENECIHEPRKQIFCGAPWAFAVVGMLSDRCCLHQGVDNGWLSVSELVECDNLNNRCQDGAVAPAMEYIINAQGLVPESCFIYRGRPSSCPSSCDDGSDWASAHICSCSTAVSCTGVDGIKTCLLSGPISATFTKVSIFAYYSSGIFKCYNYPALGYSAVTITGYVDDSTVECHWIGRYSLGTNWGENGYIRFGCNECGIAGAITDGNIACEHVS